MYCHIVGTLMHIFYCYLFVIVYKFDIVGVSISSSLTYFSLFCFIHIYLSYRHDLKEMWFWPDKNTYNDLLPYLKLAIPGALMLCAEWWTFEILVFISGYLNVAYTAT